MRASPRRPASAGFMALEKRMVFDAAAVATVAEATTDASCVADTSDDGSALAENLAAHAAAVSEAAPPKEQGRVEIAFVDSSVEDVATLISGLDPD